MKKRAPRPRPKRLSGEALAQWQKALKRKVSATVEDGTGRALGTALGTLDGRGHWAPLAVAAEWVDSPSVNVVNRHPCTAFTGNQAGG